MPVWQKAIEELGSDNLVVLGVVQEQHAERTRLYKQWREIDFPIAQDPVTKLGLAVVPLFVAIDEWGIVQDTRIRPGGLAKFVGNEFEKPENEAPKVDPDISYGYLAKSEGGLENFVYWGDEELLFNKKRDNGISNAIAAYTIALSQNKESGSILFRLGVAYRARFDEVSNDPEDFRQAARYWSLALDSNPNQYIWRRRIEQYGPMLEKPYPFYDWVEGAIADIKSRGDTPVELTVALTQTELVGRSKPDYEDSKTNPDPDGKIDRDNGEFVAVSATVVPGFVPAGKPGTVHLNFSVQKDSGTKWNNESTPLTIWVESEDAKLSKQLITFENPNSADSVEMRPIEFDLLLKNGVGECTVGGFALYNVCSEDGVCMLRRQDFKLNIPTSAEQIRPELDLSK